jgi:type II secretory pathway pseudopilin PulG
MRLRFHHRSQVQPADLTRSAEKQERGYVLLVLMLMISLLAIAALVALPPMKFRIERDREEELIHRGVQYSRAIKKYFKKFGRYPTKLEDLDSSNNTRFLRKHYKDPVTGKDFKLLHYGDPGLQMAGAGLLGGQPGGVPNLNGTPSPGGTPQPGGFGGNGSAFGGGLGGSQPGNTQGFGGSPGGQPPSSISTDNPTAGTPTAAGGDTGGAYSPNGGGDAPSTGPGSSPGGPTFGGGPIVGVVSASKKDTIREFNHKKRYNEWQFLYDPASDRGGLLTTPSQPPLQGAVNLNGQPGSPNQNGSPLGSPIGAPGQPITVNPNPQNNGNPGAPPTTDQPPQ